MFRTGPALDAPTFDEYVATAWPSLYRTAYLLADNHADAEDIAQQALERAFRVWPRVQAADSPAAYVRRVLVNTFLQSRRPVRFRREVLTDATPDRAVALGDEVDDRLLLLPKVRLLPPRQRAVLVLRYYEDLTEQQIADALGCSLGTVKSTAHAALASLRTAMAGLEEREA